MENNPRQQEGLREGNGAKAAELYQHPVAGAGHTFSMQIDHLGTSPYSMRFESTSAEV